MSAPYADFYLLPLPKKHVRAYKKMATAAGRLWRKKGALEYREFVADDLTAHWGTAPLGKLMKLKRGEVLVGAIVGYKSRAHRDRVNQQVMDDPGMAALMPKKPIFDMKRMTVGGFQSIVDA